MAVSLSRLPGLPALDAVGESATLVQRWLTWKDEFELYVTASGISDPTEKRAVLRHLAGPKVRDVFNNSISAEARGEAKDYVPVDSRTAHAPPPPPPGQTSGHLTFLKNFGQIARYVASLDGQMPHPLEL